MQVVIAIGEVIHLFKPQGLGNALRIAFIVQDGLRTRLANARRIVIGRSDQEPLVPFTNQFRDESTREYRDVIRMRLDGSKYFSFMGSSRLFPLDYQFIIGEPVLRMESILLQILSCAGGRPLRLTHRRKMGRRSKERPGGKSGFQEVLAIHHGG